MATIPDKIEQRMDDAAHEAFRKLAKGKAAKTITAALKKADSLGLKNRNGRIGAPEVQKAFGRK